MWMIGGGKQQGVAISITPKLTLPGTAPTFRAMQQTGSRVKLPAFTAATALLSVLVCQPMAARAAEVSEWDEPFQAGGYETSVAGGVFFSPSPKGELRTYDFALFTARLGYMLTTPHRDVWWRGNWELAGEVFGGGIFTGRGDYLAGVDGWLRYNFVPRESRWTPFVEVGFGVAFTDADERIVGQDFNFISGAGAGLRCALGKQWGLVLEYRAQHISNGGLADHNRGINAHGALLGVNWFF